MIYVFIRLKRAFLNKRSTTSVKHVPHEGTLVVLSHFSNSMNGGFSFSPEHSVQQELIVEVEYCGQLAVP